MAEDREEAYKAIRTYKTAPEATLAVSMMPSNLSSAQHSVVPDLMRVYESMTGRSSPEHTEDQAFVQDDFGSTTGDWNYEPSKELPGLDKTGHETEMKSKRSSRKRSYKSLQEDDDDDDMAMSTRTSNARRKKTKDSNDGRWLKRFSWSVALHKDFVSSSKHSFLITLCFKSHRIV